MTTRHKAETNRRNALASTGPKTLEGKATSARNAVRHGILSRLEVLPGIEAAEDWLDHLDATFEDLQPRGHVECLLAERVALAFWRLGRVARFERDVAAIGLERVEADAGDVLAVMADPNTPTEVRAAELQRRRVLIESSVTLDKVARYETHLERSLFRNLHELQRLQAARNAKGTAPVVVAEVEGGEAA